MFIFFLFSKKNQNNPTDEVESQQSIGKENHPIVPVSSDNDLESRKLGSEFEFNTKVGDLKRISVNQKFKEDMLIDGEKVVSFLTRITNYDIYLISFKTTLNN